MSAITATAPGKIILFGEHAVVYGRPAIAVPVNQVRARVVISAEPRRPSGWVGLQAPSVGLESELDHLPVEHPLSKAIGLALAESGVSRLPACTIRVTSTIPVAAGLGSGAAVSVALIRSVAAFLGRSLPDERVSALAYEVEKLHHGTPSGIDNTVIAHALPVYFTRGEPVHVLNLPQPFTLVIADTGIASPTGAVVADVRHAWETTPKRLEELFDAVGRLSVAARTMIESGNPIELGALMDQNHTLLQQMGVSCLELDQLVDAARRAGALGAKLSGGGRGGNMLALVAPGDDRRVAQALIDCGAQRVIATNVQMPKGRQR